MIGILFWLVVWILLGALVYHCEEWFDRRRAARGGGLPEPRDWLVYLYLAACTPYIGFRLGCSAVWSRISRLWDGHA